MDPVKNFAKVTVSTGYDADDVSIALTSGHGTKLPQPSTDGAFNLVWWNASDYADPSDDPMVEIVRCTARSTDTLTVTRAQEGTSASVKNVSGKTYKMILSFTKLSYDGIQRYYPAVLLSATNTVNVTVAGATTATVAGAEWGNNPEETPATDFSKPTGTLFVVCGSGQITVMAENNQTSNKRVILKVYQL